MATKFKFRRHATIGTAAAEQDKLFLHPCFVDTGDLEILLDCRDAHRLVLGRTGTGKTALLARLSIEQNVTEIQPENLAFNFIANSNILQFFLNAGVKLDLFFRLLWRHVFAVELLKARYGIKDEKTTVSFVKQLKEKLVRDKAKAKAIDYLTKWSTQFWRDTEYRVEEITKKVEQQLEASLTSDLKLAQLDGGVAKTLSEEARAEIVRRGQAVINEVHMKELSDLLRFLDEDVFDDDQQTFYITIDRLDENWVEDRFRYLLIRSLIETIKDFFKVRNVKIIAALRNDLLERVFKLTRDPGFQEEKYRDLYLRIRWDREKLMELLDKRVNFLVRSAYTGADVDIRSLLPRKVNGGDPVEYMLKRTMERPRELIEFFNDCIEHSEGSPAVTKAGLLKAEADYSKNRLRSLQDEWYADYPTLIKFVRILRDQQEHLRLDELELVRIEEFCLEHTVENLTERDILSVEARKVAEGVTSAKSLLSFLFHVFHRCGVLALKLEKWEQYEWCYQTHATIPPDLINMDTRAKIHPMLWRVLGIHA